MLRQQSRKTSNPGDDLPTSQLWSAHSLHQLTQHVLFAVILCAWSITITAWLIQATLSGGGGARHPAGAAQLRCNPANRVVAACAHRGNASELMQNNAPLLDQLKTLWQQGGIKCFDMDAVPLADGNIIMGHPEHLAALARGTQQGRHEQQQEQQQEQEEQEQEEEQQQEEQQQHRMQAGDISSHTLEELRQRGINELVAPLLTDLMAAFAELVASDTAAAASSTAAAATDGGAATDRAAAAHALADMRAAKRRRRWGGLPVLSVELKWGSPNADNDGKGEGRRPQAAQQRVIKVAQKLQLSEHLLLWYGAADGALAAAAKAQDGKVMRGLVIRDRDVYTAADSSSSSSSRSKSSTSSSSEHGTASTQQPHADGSTPSALSQLPNDKQLLAYDVLAPSIKIEEAALAHMVALRPVFAWTVDSDAHLTKARRLGLDMVISNQPVKQKQVSEEGGAKGAC